MLSLSVTRWGFTDKLLKINKLSVKRPFFWTSQNFQRQGLHQPHTADEKKKKIRCFSQRTGPLYKTNLTNRHKNLLLSECKYINLKRYHQIFL